MHFSPYSWHIQGEEQTSYIQANFLKWWIQSEPATKLFKEFHFLSNIWKEVEN